MQTAKRRWGFKFITNILLRHSGRDTIRLPTRENNKLLSTNKTYKRLLLSLNYVINFYGHIIVTIFMIKKIKRYEKSLNMFILELKNCTFKLSAKHLSHIFR